jgi:hypothetical protein
MTPGKWIAERIRWFLAGDQEAREETRIIEQARISKITPPIRSLPDPSKVADEPK